MRVAGSLALILAGLVLGGAAWARPDGGARLYIRPLPAVFGAWGPYAGHPTARLLPPGSPGYGTRSPYPLDGPHVETARLLAADSLRNAKATLLVNYGFQRVA